MENEKLNETLLNEIVELVKELRIKVDRLNGVNTVYENNKPVKQKSPQKE